MNVVVMEWGKVEVDLGYIEENQIRCVMPNQTLKTTFPFPHLWRGAQIEHFVLGLRNEILIVTDNSSETWHAFFFWSIPQQIQTLSVYECAQRHSCSLQFQDPSSNMCYPLQSNFGMSLRDKGKRSCQGNNQTREGTVCKIDVSLPG